MRFTMLTNMQCPNCWWRQNYQSSNLHWPNAEFTISFCVYSDFISVYEFVVNTTVLSIIADWSTYEWLIVSKCRDRMEWYLELQLPVQLVHITTKVVSSNSVYGEVYSMQIYIKFVSDFRQVDGFLLVLLFPPPIVLTATIWLKYCWTWL
jgi:hypothetical protein